MHKTGYYPSIRLNAFQHKIKKDYTSGQYKVKCFTCDVIVSSYNYEANAKKSKHSTQDAITNKHYKHDVRIVEHA